MLAQQGIGPVIDALWELAPWIGAVVVLLALMAAAVFVFRRWWRQQHDAINRPAFTLAQLREMRDSGQLTPEEFDRAKATLTARGLTDGNRGKGSSDNARQ